MEKELIDRCKNGDKEAFNELIMTYQSKVYALSLNILQNEIDAEDAAQEAFVKIYKNLHKFQYHSSLSTWIYKITWNTALDFNRKRKKNNSMVISLYKQDENGDEAHMDIIGHAMSAEEEAEKGFLREEILGAMAKLKDKYRHLVVLRFIHELSYEEITAVTGMPIGSVKSGLSRAKEELKKNLNGRMEHF